jgi:hypothetical protein
MTKRFQWLILAVLLTVPLVAAMYFGADKPSERISLAPSSYSAAPHGTKACFVTLERLGYKPRRWRLEWARLKNERGILLYAPSEPLTSGGRYKALSAPAAREIERWISRGNTLIYLLNPNERTLSRNVLLTQLGINLTTEDMPSEIERTQTLRQFLPTRIERDYDYVLPVPWTSNVRRLSADAVPAFATDRGRPVVVTDRVDYGHVHLIPYGEGRIYVFSSSSFIDNQFLGRSDNLALLLNILDLERGKNGVVLFDEYHHGYSAEFGAASFTQLPVVRFAAWQALALFVLFVLSSWRRFGRPVPLIRDTRRSIREYTQSLGNLYFRARAHREALDFLFQGLRRSLCSRYNLPESAPHAVIEDRLRGQRGAAEAWSELARDCDRLLERRKVPNADLLATARKMEEFRKLMA